VFVFVISCGTFWFQMERNFPLANDSRKYESHENNDEVSLLVERFLEVNFGSKVNVINKISIITSH
jgi:hypothetical protein